MMNEHNNAYPDYLSTVYFVIFTFNESDEIKHEVQCI